MGSNGLSLRWTSSRAAWIRVRASLKILIDHAVQTRKTPVPTHAIMKSSAAITILGCLCWLL